VGIYNPILWNELPSYELVRGHVERSILSSRMDAENFSLIDAHIATGKPTWETLQDYLDTMKIVANGSHRIVPSIQDFIKETKPPILRIGDRVLKFWREFDSLKKTFDPNTLFLSKCWKDDVLP